MGVGQLDSRIWRDRELKDTEMGGGGWTGVGGVSALAVQLQISISSQHMSVWLACAETPSFFDCRQPVCVIYVGPLFHCAYTGKSPVYTRIA